AHNTITHCFDGCRRTMGKYWNSIAFRLTLSHGLLAILTTLILLLFIYSQVVEVLRTQLSEQIDHAEQRLVTMFSTGGVNPVADAISLAIADELDGGDDLFMLVDGDGGKLAGNVELIETLPSHSGLFLTTVTVAGQRMGGYFKVQHFPD